MASSKLPEKLYVVGRDQLEYDPVAQVNVVKGLPFGFLNAYEPNKKTWASKKNTQMQWAYGNEHGTYGKMLGWQMRGDQLWLVGEEREWRHGTYHTTWTEKPASFSPQIWDNTPQTGFKILNSVSRYSTSNKLWRIADPRGLELEISTACLEEIIDKAGILKGGEIDAACAWMSNKNLVVV